ncbi:hypothetical protein ACLESO_53280 [Pyxidicoccus sp. 3LG]
MLSKLQSRIRQFATVAAPPPQAQKAASKPRPDVMSAPRLAESRNPALRTLGGDSLFEANPVKPGAKAAQSMQEPGVSNGNGIEEHNPTDPFREEAVRQAIAANGKPVEFVNSDGKAEDVKIAQVPLLGEDSYLVSVGDDTFRVDFKDGTTANREAFLAKAIDAYSETPPELRRSLSTIVVTPESGGDTATGMPAAASAGNGTITFYDNAAVLSSSLFHHELAHLIGGQQENKGDDLGTNVGEAAANGGNPPPPIPDGWEEAAKTDGNFVSEYAKADYDQDKNYTEDFADAWARYMNVLDAGPEAVARFREMYPERAAILEELYPPPQMMMG